MVKYTVATLSESLTDDMIQQVAAGRLTRSDIRMVCVVFWL
jgi:hypothetical protein